MSITNFSRWEQAFKVYSDIYSRAYPHRSAELIQYCHVIHSISMQYIWENVYDYDRDFRMHIARHPGQNWSIILQQAWSMRLRDRIKILSITVDPQSLDQEMGKEVSSRPIMLNPVANSTEGSVILEAAVAISIDVFIVSWSGMAWSNSLQEIPK